MVCACSIYLFFEGKDIMLSENNKNTTKKKCSFERYSDEALVKNIQIFVDIVTGCICRDL